jgi:hypothetical protein
MAVTTTAAAAAAQHTAAAAAQNLPGLAALPRDLVGRHIFGRLPVDLRLRCREVCSAWRDTLSDVSNWQRLDLSDASGGLTWPASDALLRAAVARAGGQLQALNVFGCELTHAEVLAAVTASAAATLRELCVFRVWEDRDGGEDLEPLEELLRAAPRLQICNAHVGCKLHEARAVLRNEPPFGALRAHELHVFCLHCQGLADEELQEGNEPALRAEKALLSLAADVRQHAPLRELHVWLAWLAEASALDALVDTALAMRLSAFSIDDCRVLPNCATALVRLLAGGASSSLTSLHVGRPDFGPGTWLLDEPSVTLLYNALEANSTLTSLTLFFWHDVEAGAELIGVLTAHPSLRSLSLFDNYAHDEAEAAGDALGALLAANSPVLEELNVRHNGLGDVGLGRLFDALPANTHLRKLDCSGNSASEAFMRARLLPAVLQNNSLRELDAGYQAWRQPPFAVTLEAVQFVRDREEARRTAASS